MDWWTNRQNCLFFGDARCDHEYGRHFQISAASRENRRHRSKITSSPAVHAPKLGLRPEEAAAVIGSEGVFRDMRAAGWVEPIYCSNNVTIFDYLDVARAFARLRAGEKPIAR